MQKVFFGIFFTKTRTPRLHFFVYIKLLISLLNGALFRLGKNFSVRGYGATKKAAAFQQLFKADSKNPSRLLLRSRFGEKSRFHC